MADLDIHKSHALHNWVSLYQRKAQTGLFVNPTMTRLQKRDAQGLVFSYLSLLADAYSKLITGYCPPPLLTVEGSLKALEMTLQCAQPNWPQIGGSSQQRGKWQWIIQAEQQPFWP
jgi:hypothetical protein